MTQNNIYMDDENSEIKVNVRPEAEDIVMNAAASAAANAEAASVSASAASNLLESIRGIKTGVELFVAQAMEGLQDLYANLTAQLSSLKDTCVQNVNNAYTLAIQLIQQTEMDALARIHNLGTRYVNEAAGYAHAAQEIVDFHVSTEHLNQSKGLLTGDVSDDATVLADVKKYAHSTYCGDQAEGSTPGYLPDGVSPLDPKKFTVVGSPTITNDGIASGFSTSNCITANLPYAITLDKIDVYGSFTTGSTYTTFGIILNIGSTTQLANALMQLGIRAGGKVIGIGCHDDTTWTGYYSTNTVSDNTKYYYHLYYDTSLKLDISADNISWTNWIDANPTVNSAYSQSLLTFGSSAAATGVFTGSMDLKQLLFKVYGVPVFSGNKTGIDTIKPVNFTAITSGNDSPFENPSLPFSDSGLTISADGVVSGFSTTNHISLTLQSAITLDKIDVYGSFTTVDTYDSVAIITNIGSILNLADNVGQVVLTNQKKLAIGCHNDTTWTGYYSTNTVSDNTKYYYHWYYNNGIKLDVSTDNVTWTNWISETPTVNSAYSRSDVVIGAGTTANSVFTGSIDLNPYRFYVDGDLVCQSCLKIPYTESKTGSKIVDSYYRDRVNDMAGQFGYAPYYTLSDTDFTLPMGELYGMIEALRNKIDELSNQS